MELGPRGEQLTPAQQFVQIIDGHFAAIGGRGGQAATPRTSEEGVSLIFTKTFGLLGPLPNAALAYRPIPDQANLAELFWPENHGHIVETYASPSTDLNINVRYFVKDNEIWVMENKHLTRVSTGMILYTGTLYPPSPPACLDDEQAANFLQCLQQAIPVLPESPDSKRS